MLVLSFEGWFQCRFATDPDPTDEPRGITGPTFVVPGEPDFDRVIRLQDPVYPRFPHEHDIGVNVMQVALVGSGGPTAGGAGTVLTGHPLVGARVSLLDGPQFHQRNYIIVEGFLSPIDPFHIEISGGGIVLRRRDEWDETRPGLTIRDVYLDPRLFAHRRQTIEIRSATAAEATGIMDYDGYRQRRKRDLEALLQREQDPVRRLGLAKRIGAIDKDAHSTGFAIAAQQFLGMLSTFAIDINGRAEVIDPDNALGGQVGTSQDWPIEFWMAGYDVDSLCGYLRGTLRVPFRPDQRPASSSIGT